MHPIVNDLKSLTENQIEQKILRLNSIYFMTENQDVRQQMILIIDSCKLELEERRVLARIKQQEQGNNDLDSLINIS